MNLVTVSYKGKQKTMTFQRGKEVNEAAFKIKNNKYQAPEPSGMGSFLSNNDIKNSRCSGNSVILRYRENSSLNSIPPEFILIQTKIRLLEHFSDFLYYEIWFNNERSSVLYLYRL